MINIVYASNNDFFHFLAVAITSVCVSNKDNDIRIFILDTGIHAENKSFLKNYENKYPNIKIIFVECNDLEKKLNLPTFLTEGSLGIHISSYARLFLPSLLPLDVEKVLYLDGDTLTLSSIDELWDINIDDYMCAGVDDPAPVYLKGTINFKEDDYYINAGVLLINLKKWRDNNVELEFINFINNNRDSYFQHDQGVLNAVFKDKILLIHPKYNYRSHFCLGGNVNTVKWIGCKYYYNQEIMDEASKNIVIKHCKPFEAPLDYNKYIKLSGISTDNSFNFQKPYKIYSLTNFLYNPIGKKILGLVPKFIAVNIYNYRFKRWLSQNLK